MNKRGGARKGAGRRRLSDEPLRTLSVRVTSEFYETIDSLAKERKMSKGQTIMSLLKIQK